ISKLVPSSVLTDALLNKDGGYVACYKLAQSFKGSKGIINTFSEIEQHSIDALSKGQTPPIYAIGPLIDLKGHPNSNVDQAQCGSILKWLDEQPPCSVIFLCFGSRGSFGPYQTREIALALQHCGLCVLRQCGLCVLHNRPRSTTRVIFQKGIWNASLELKLDYRTDSDVVMANEIEKGLKQLMDKDSVVHKK
ncbi:hypothetical protein S245_059246, partial [Arachis hypogaea]